MNFIARVVRDSVDQAMLLFQLRRLGIDATFIVPPKGGTDMHITGEVAEEHIEALAKALPKGALHVAEQHLSTPDGTAYDSIAEAEATLGGPFTTPDISREKWSFGDDLTDHVVQILHAADKATLTEIRETAGVRVDLAIQSLQGLIASGDVRKYRTDDERYGLAATTRAKIDG